MAASHGWSLDVLTLFEMVGEIGLDPDREQSILHPSEVELGETTREVMERVEELRPTRVVFDSLSEMRLLAQNPLRYRRQILAFKHFFASRQCTVLLLDDRTSEPTDLQLHSIAHGVISLEQAPRDFGAERRRLRVVKMRGIKFRGGYHDFVLDTGGLTLFPRLVANEHHREFEIRHVSTGNARLDALLGGGLMAGTNTLLSGPSGVGKTTTAVNCMLAAPAPGANARPTTCSTRVSARWLPAAPPLAWTCSRISRAAGSLSSRSIRRSFRPASSRHASATRWSGSARPSSW